MLSSHHRTFYERGFERQLRRRQCKCFAREVFRYTFHLVQHATGLNECDPILDAPFAFTLPYFERFLRNRLVGEHTNPDFSAALDVTRHRAASGFELSRRQTPAPGRLQPIFAEADGAAAQRQAAIAALVLLAEFRSFGLQHLFTSSTRVTHSPEPRLQCREFRP